MADRNIVLAFVFAVCLTFCPFESAGQHTTEERLDVQYTIPSDDSFIGQIRDVKVSNGEVFIADYQRNQVLVYTDDGIL